MLMSCHNKTHHSGNIKDIENESTSDTSMIRKRDTPSCSIDRIKPRETIIEEWQLKGKEIIKKQGDDIYVYFLSNEFCPKDKFLKTEITNQKQDTIFYVSDLFLSYNKSDSSWVPLSYPENYIKTSLGHLIPPQKNIILQLYFPSEGINPEGEYRLQLVFCNASRDIYYYINKNFSASSN